MAACTARVEKAVSGVKGVTSCSVSLLTNSMGVEGTAGSEEIIAAVRAAGYDAALKKENKEQKTLSISGEDVLSDRETPVLKKRLTTSLGFLVILMYVSMGHMMWGWPLPSFFDNNHVAMGLLQLLLTVVIMVINQRFFVSGFKSLWHRAPNMDTLVALGATAAFGYSTFALFAMTDALKGLMRLASRTATLEKDGVEVVVPVEQVVKGDIFVVRPGENIPVDGTVIGGNSAAATKAPIAKVADRVSGFFVPAVILIAVITVIAWLVAGHTAGFALARGIFFWEAAINL